MLHYKIIHLQEVNSTNTYLKEYLRTDKAEEGTVILADQQSKGRGRGQNSWFSEEGMSLTMSILIRPSLKSNHHFMLNEFLSLAMVDVLAAYGIFSKVKWPNDIYIADKKIAGLLIENVIIGDVISESVLGIGLNVNQQRFPADLQNPVSMAQVMQRSAVLSEVRDKMLDCIARRYETLRTGNFNALHSEYSAHLYKRGEAISFTTAGQQMEGTLFNVFQSGELYVRLSNGKLQSYLFDTIRDLI
jgi:BirA family transcriptional regulator, biotin operon repressor / biotin---[acetyl-CoA-carboxylase] ligase